MSQDFVNRSINRSVSLVFNYSMSSWSALRRSPPPIHCMPITQLRYFSHLNGTDVQPDPKSTPISFLKWVSGIITSSTLAFAIYSYSSPNYPSLSFSHTSQSLDHYRSKFLFVDAYRRKVFFKYEKRIRMRSPPEKVFIEPKSGGLPFLVLTPLLTMVHTYDWCIWSDSTSTPMLLSNTMTGKSEDEKCGARQHQNILVIVEDSVLPSLAGKFRVLGTLYLNSGLMKTIFFNQEIQVFEYFASFETHDGEIFMTPADLMRAVVPVFPPSESHLVRDGYLRGERNPGELRCAPSKFFMLFDTNNDGHVSFKEYIFFVTLLSIPESSFSVAFKMFDLDCNGEIDIHEFKKVMTLMRAHNRQGAHHSDGLRGGHNLGGHIDSGGLLRDFFGEDGKKHLQYDTFVQFLRDLHEEMLKLEFAHYDYKFRGTISAKDFALSMVASADLKYLNKLLDRVDDIDNESQLSHIRISFEEFKNFAELRKKLQPFSLALFCFGQANGLLTRNDFKRAASQVCGVSLTDNMIEIVFHVFDTNRDGNLSSDEFIRVLEKRARDIAEPTEAGILNFMSCCGNCTRSYKSYLLSSWSTSC